MAKTKTLAIIARKQPSIVKTVDVSADTNVNNVQASHQNIFDVVSRSSVQPGNDGDTLSNVGDRSSIHLKKSTSPMMFEQNKDIEPNAPRNADQKLALFLAGIKNRMQESRSFTSLENAIQDVLDLKENDDESPKELVYDSEVSQTSNNPGSLRYQFSQTGQQQSHQRRGADVHH